MQMKLRRLLPVFGLVCASLFVAADARTYDNSCPSDPCPSPCPPSNPCPSVCDPCPKDPCCNPCEDPGTYKRGTYREITPNAGPRVACGADVYVTADFIWWKAVQDGTRYGTTGIRPGQLRTLPDGNPPSNNDQLQLTNVPRGRSRSVGRDWSPGFKVGLGLNLCHDGWDLYAQYTWLQPSNSSSLTRNNRSDCPSEEELLPFGAYSLELPVTNRGIYGSREEGKDRYNGWDRISSHWSLHFNVIDLELGRNFYLSQFLTMRPFIGLKGTWQHQDMKTRLSPFFLDITASDTGNIQDINGIDVGANENLSGPYVIDHHNDVWGIGLRGGFNTAWYINTCWSIYGDLAWTAMWTEYEDLRRKDRVRNGHVCPPESGEPVGDGHSPVMVHIKGDDYCGVKYVGELELGLRWETWFCDDNYHFAVQAGWEQQVWINWNTFQSTIVPDHWGDLSLGGLNVKFRFDF